MEQCRHCTHAGRMTTTEILESLRENYPDCLTADGFDDAIIGIAEGACRPAVVCYDYEKCVKVLMRNSDMNEEEAQEYVDFNTTGAYVGEHTPVFLHRWRK